MPTGQRSGWRVQAASGKANLSLDISPQVCVDNMTGQPHPYMVSLTMNGQSMQGCGGNPARLLQGVRWQLKAIGGKVVTSDASLEFLTANRLVGSNGCNRVMGRYALSGEGLSFSQLASTRMACEPADMTQADTVDQYLSSVRGFAFDDEGALVLKTEKGELMLQPAGSPSLTGDSGIH
ncbi:MAG: META domain-containing protein [Comamonas sp.]